MAITTYNFSGGASSASGVTTVATGNSAGTVIPAGTLIIICFTSDSISTTAPTLSISTVGGGTPVATHGAPITSGASGSAGAGIWHQCWRVVTTADLPTGGTIVTVTTNQAAAKTIACMGWSGVANTLRGTVATATSTTGVPTVASTGTVPQIGDLVVGCVSAENGSAVPGIDSDSLNGVWFSNGVANGTAGAAGINCAVEYKRVNGPGAQTFNPPTLGGADSVICLYALAPLDSAVTQAAYRFYADDGSESASTALAAQDTAASADLTAGNVSLSVRLREQSTNVTDGLAADDWQLRWERNASGNWFDVANDLLLDTYADSNLDTNTALFTAGNIVGQTFQGDGKKLSRAGFVLKRIGTAAANVTAVLYAHSGTFGSGGVGTGAVLATSTTAKAVSSLSLFSQWEYFDFDGTFTLASGTSYVIGLTVSATTDSANCAWFGSDFSSPSHAGNGVNFTLAGSVWAAQSDDRIFRVNGTDPAAPLVAVPFNSANLTDGAATTSRLTGGTGTFVAGKVSEDGLADDILLTGRNYTELLYAVTLVKAWLSNGDTVRFRVVRVGSPTTPTFTQTPTVNVTVTSGFTGTATLSGDGSLGTAQTPGPTQTAALAGSGSLTTSATVTAVGAATLSGSGTLATTQVVGPKQTAALSGDGSLSAAGQPKPSVSAALSGSGSLAATGVADFGVPIASVTSQLFVNGVAFGSPVTHVLSNSTSNVYAEFTVPGLTLAQLQSGTLTVRHVVTRTGSTTSATVFVDSVELLADYKTTVPPGTGAFTGTATLSGSGSLTTVQVPRPTVTVALSGDGSLTTAQVPRPVGVATLTGSGSLTTVQAPRPAVAVSLSGDGALSTAQVPRPAAAAALSGDGTLATTQVPRPAVSAALSGAGNLSTTQALTAATTATLSGSGTLTTAALVSFPVTAALSGSGTLAATGTPISAATGTATLSGSGSLSTTQVPSLAVTVSLSGDGALSTTQAPRPAVTVALSGSGSLTTTQAPRPAVAVALSGSGTLSTAQSLTQATTATLSGSGTLTAVGVPLATAAGTATLSGSGTLATTQVPRPTGVATLSGDGSLTTAQTPRIAAIASLSGSGTLAAVGAAFGNFVGFATLSGDGTLSTAQVSRFPVSTALSGSGSLTTAQVVRFTGTAILSGSGTLSSTQVSGVSRTATLSGSGTLATAQVPRPAPTVALSGSGTLTTAGVPRIAAAATLSGDGTLSTAQVVRVSVSAALSGSGTLSTTAAPSVARSAALSGSGALTVVTSLGAVRAVSLSGSGTLATTQSLSVTGFAALTGSGTLAYAAAVMAQATAALSGTGNLTVETSATGALVEFVGVIPI